MNLTTNDKLIMDSLPFPTLLLCLSGKLLGSNKMGTSLYKEIKNDLLILNLEEIKTKRIVIENKDYLLKSTPMKKENKLYAFLIILIEENDIKSFFNNNLEEYQSAIEDLQAVFDNSYDVLYVADGKGKTLRVSSKAQSLWGKKPEELIGKSVFELEQSGIYSPSVTREVLKKGKKIQMIQHTKTGRSLMVTSTPICDVNGKIKRIVNASRDITEIKELEAELEQMKAVIEEYQRKLSKLNMNKSDLIYRSKVMADLEAILPKIAAVDSTVLVTGESGVGKEVIVGNVQKFGPRKDNPFIKINCAAIPEGLLESELFGYEKGAFTNASNDGKKGLFELANTGTIFLDEIGDMSLNLQAKLLRVLQEGEIMRIGGSESIKVDVRIIAATNQELLTKVNKKLFREDLYYRLNVIPITIPPLRDRKEDIVPLIQHFIKLYSTKYKVTKIFSQDLLNLLEEYSWPGNVRELQNIVERLIVTTDFKNIELKYIPTYILESINSIGLRQQSETGVKINNIIPLKEAVNQLEKNLIKMAAKKCSNLNEIAQLLGVNQSTISRKVQKLGIKL